MNILSLSNHMSNVLSSAPLGQEVAYPDRYDPGLLFPIPRDGNRQSLRIPDVWHGADIWNAYEVSWLDARGKPVVALARFTFPSDSPFLIESKSLKLYLNSLNQEPMSDIALVQQRIEADLSAAAGSPVAVEVWRLRDYPDQTYGPMQGECIDDIDIDCSNYSPEPGMLKCAPCGTDVSETLVSDLLKSNCPVTGQPDWASVQITYSGPKIDRASLLQYIVSLRQHTEFHEHCIEKMYCDIWQACQPTALSVYARYTRRGGLDINPWRSSHAVEPSHIRTIRQ